MKNKSAITLVALIITIIVLLILATVSISLVINNGVLDKAQHGIDKYSEEEELEQIKLAVASAMLKGNGFLDTENLNSELHERIDENENAERNGTNWNYKGYLIDENGNVEKKDKLLPAEYQQVEYIESSGNQWIDIKLNRISRKAQIKIKFMISSQKEYQNLFCCRDGNNSRTLFITNLNGFRNDQNNEQNTLNQNLELNKIYTIDSSQTYFKCNDVILKEYSKDTGVDVDSNFYILNCNDIDNYSNMSSKWQYVGRIYDYEIYDDVIIRKFIPCYRKTDNKSGLYDLVEGKFYTNQGTGTFGYGMEDGTYVAPTDS